MSEKILFWKTVVNGKIKKYIFRRDSYGRIYLEITVLPPANRISESSSNGGFRNTDDVRCRNGISPVVPNDS